MASTDTFRRTLHFIRTGNIENRKAVYGAPEFRGMDHYAITENLACVLSSRPPSNISYIDRRRALAALCQCGDIPEITRALLSVACDLCIDEQLEEGPMDKKGVNLECILYEAFFQSIGRRILGTLPPSAAPPQKDNGIPTFSKAPQ